MEIKKVKNKDKLIFSVPFISGDYFSDSTLTLPFSIMTVEKSVSKKTPLRKNEGITIIFVKSGQGKMIVNTEEQPLQRGNLICLATYHYFSILPDPDSTIDIVECRMAYGAYLYMAACPYYHFTEMTLPHQPATVLLDEENTIRVEKLVNEVIAECAKPQRPRGELEFLLMMRLFGILQKFFELNQIKNGEHNSL